MNRKKKIISVAVLVLALVILGVAFTVGTQFLDKTAEGEKSITIYVTDSVGETTTYSLNTDAKYLSEAMSEAEGLTFSGTNDTYGLMLEEVNGERAVYETDGAYWSILVDGEYGLYGIDSQPVTDGAEYGLVYTKS